MAEEKTNMPTLEDQYQRLIDARNYHYDNLNKWLITFYAIIGALFLAFYTLYSNDAIIEVELIVAIVGYIVSISALLSIKGYFYWEYNWIEKLYRFEKNVLRLKGDEQVYSSLINKEKYDFPCCPIKSANVSTTKVALFVTFGVAVAWGFIIGMLGFDLEYKLVYILMTIGISILVSYILMIFGSWALHSELYGLDELSDSADIHKSGNAKGVCITIVVLIAIATFFATMGYVDGRTESVPVESVTLPSDTIITDNQAHEPIKLEINVKQDTAFQSHQDVWFGIIGSLLGAIVGAFMGWGLTTLYDKSKEKKRKEQYVKEIQRLTDAVLEHTVDCNNAIKTSIDNIYDKPYLVAGLKQGIIASIKRLSKLDANMVYEAYEFVGKGSQFNKFLNLLDQLLTQYTGIYAYNERNDQTIIAYTKEFEEIQLEIVQHLRDTLLMPKIQSILTAYNTAKMNAKVPIDLKFIHDELIVPAYRTSSNPLTHDSELYAKAERAHYLYNTICSLQYVFAGILQRSLMQIQETIKLIEKRKL